MSNCGFQADAGRAHEIVGGVSGTVKDAAISAKETVESKVRVCVSLLLSLFAVV